MRKKFSIFIICLFILIPLSRGADISKYTELSTKSYIKTNDQINISNMIDQVNESILLYYLEGLVEIGPRYTGSDNCKEAAEYINNEFKKMGLYSFIQPWSYFRRKCQNVVATINGTDQSSDAVFILCAHYDTTSNSPGANDDGSGIAAMMTIAKIFSESSFNHTIKFIAFSGEEVGLFGSHYYASKAYEKDENIIAVLNLDTIGYAYTENDGDIFRLWLPERSEWLLDFVKNICEKYKDYFNFKIQPVPTFGCDHGSFIDYGFDGVLFGQYANLDGMHTPDDTIVKINFTYLEKITKCVLVTLYELSIKEIDLQIRILNPREGYFHFFNKKMVSLPQYNLWRIKYNGLTFILGRTTAKVEVNTDEEVESIVFVIDGVSIPSTVYSNKTEWSINGFTRPLVGRHTLGVYAYTTSGKMAYDEMDLFIVTFLFDAIFIFL